MFQELTLAFVAFVAVLRRFGVAEELAQRIQGLTVNPVRLNTTYFVPLLDSEIPERLRELLNKWRQLAKFLDYNGPIAWVVRDGLTVQHMCEQGWKAGIGWSGCRKDWSTDLPTTAGIIFLIPRFLPDTLTPRPLPEKIQGLTTWAQQYAFPPEQPLVVGTTPLTGGILRELELQTGELAFPTGKYVATNFPMKWLGANVNIALSHGKEGGGDSEKGWEIFFLPVYTQKSDANHGIMPLTVIEAPNI